MFDSSTFIVLAIVAFVALVLFTFVYLATRYKRCPSDQILVIYGRVQGGKSSRTMHGGGALVWPLIQDYAYISLTPMTINIPLENALSLQNIRIHVPSTFTVGVSTNSDIMTNAAERLLHLDSTAIEDMAKEIIFGQLRLTVASLTIEQINQDRESFLESVRHNVEPELNKIGLHLINVNITDITDESDYIESIGKKAASEALNKAKVDVAEQDKLGSIGEAAANRERDIRVAENFAEAEKGKKKADSEQRIYVQEREAEAVDGENVAKANIAKSNAELAIQEADARKNAQVAEREAEVAIQQAAYLAEAERLKAAEIAREETEKLKVEIAAEALAERIRREAKGEADGILLRYQAEAEGVKQLLEAKAEGYKALVSSTNGDSQAAATLLLIEKMEELVAKQVEAISNLQIDKITVWDSGNGNGSGSSTSGFISNLVRSFPPLHDLSEMVGIELPEFLGKVAKEDDSIIEVEAGVADIEPVDESADEGE
ncbi:flotillin family protein [Candidatus Leptofilum sp.]|uniref:flotillin family protein n=1 Tax=Candidatus Leptofilum sp. TaxID=3241576 RepID=UPI003B59F2A4